MAMPLSIQLRYWGLAAAALGLVLWALGDVILPFVLGAALAYFLNPLVNALERLGLGRVVATVLISLAVLAGMVLALLVLVPTLVAQAAALIETAPQLFGALHGALIERFPDIEIEDSALRKALADLGQWMQARGGELLGSVLGSVRSLVGLLLLLVVVPVVGVYLLLDWNRLLMRIDDLLPRQHAPVIRRLAGEIDRVVAAFIRGMGSVCLMMAAYYGLALMAVGLQFGLVVGALAGLLTFIPYVGAVLGGVLAIGLGLYQFWGDWLSVGLVAGVFMAGQIVESNVITPRIVGRSVGLHPVWILLAITVFATLFGLVGMLVAVPLAAAVGVLVRHATQLYLQSPLYQGSPETPLRQPEQADDAPQRRDER
mgnify:CR=1 FL=1